MAIYKRGQIYWYKFTFNGEAIRESTRQKNQHTARQMEAAHRTSLAKGEVGIRDKKAIPILKSFCVRSRQPPLFVPDPCFEVASLAPLQPQCC